jgi:carboxypeptidase PM20D1
MKVLLIRVLVAAVVVTGALTAVSVSRLVLADPPPRPQGPLLPFSFQEEGAPERLADALRFPTAAVDPGGAEGDGWAGFHGFLEHAFPLTHEALAVEAVGEGSLLYRWEGSDPGRAPILLSTHLDMAARGQGAGSEGDAGPTGVFEGGMIRGAGILDGRGPAIAMLEAVEGLLAQGFTPGRTVLIAFGHDRHRGGLEGARRIAGRLEESGVRAEWVLGVGPGVTTGAVPGVRAPVGLVATAEKGRLAVGLAEASGGGAGALEADADLAGRVLAALEADPLPARLEDPYRELIGRLAGRMDPGTGLLATNMWLFRRPLLWALAADEVWESQVRSGVEGVPAGGAGESGGRDLDARTGTPPTLTLAVAPWDSPDRLLAQVRDRAGTVGVEVSVREPETRAIQAGRISSAEGPGFEAIREAVHRVFPDVVGVGPYLATGPTDARHYEAVADKAYRFAPVRAERADLIGPEARAEVLTVRQYLQMIRFYGELIGRSAGG